MHKRALDEACVGNMTVSRQLNHQGWTLVICKSRGSEDYKQTWDPGSHRLVCIGARGLREIQAPKGSNMHMQLQSCTASHILDKRTKLGSDIGSRHVCARAAELGTPGTSQHKGEEETESTCMKLPWVNVYPDVMQFEQRHIGTWRISRS